MNFNVVRTESGGDDDDEKRGKLEELEERAARLEQINRERKLKTDVRNATIRFIAGAFLTIVGLAATIISILKNLVFF